MRTQWVVRLSALCLLAISSGCSDGVVAMQVSLLKKEGDCWVQLSDDELAESYPRKNELCTSSGTPTLISGIDRVVVVIDYSVDLDEPAPAPSLSIYLDGVRTPVDETILRAVDNNRRFASVEFVLPVTRAEKLRVAVETPSGYAGSVGKEFTIRAAPATLSIAQCEGQPKCVLVGGTSTEVVVSAPGTRTREVTLESTLNGIQDSEPQAIELSTIDDGHVFARKKLPVPFARSKDVWRLIVRSIGSSSSLDVVFDSPPIVATLSCGTDCMLERGTSVVLTVSAPAELRGTQATIRTAVDAIPSLVPIKIDLVESDGATRDNTALSRLTVPESGKVWQIDVDVQGYAASSLRATLIP